MILHFTINLMEILIIHRSSSTRVWVLTQRVRNLFQYTNKFRGNLNHSPSINYDPSFYNKSYKKSQSYNKFYHKSYHKISHSFHCQSHNKSYHKKYHHLIISYICNKLPSQEHCSCKACASYTNNN
jgi:hypothetical protein